MSTHTYVKVKELIPVIMKALHEDNEDSILWYQIDATRHPTLEIHRKAFFYSHSLYLPCVHVLPTPALGLYLSPYTSLLVCLCAVGQPPGGVTPMVSG